MQLSTVGTVIATRKLTLSNGKMATVKIGKPKRFRGGNDDYYCAYQIVGIGDKRIRYAGGVDTIQALRLALVQIGAYIGATREAKAGTVSWDAGSARGDFGFPEN
jgi:hypothetical protein